MIVRASRIPFLILLATLSATARQAPPGGRVEGVVVDSVTGRPLSGVPVMVMNPAGGSGPPTLSTTGTDGRFVFENIVLRRFSLGAGRSGYSFNDTVLALEPGSRISDVVLRLNPTGIVVGRVIEPSGRPAVQAQVQAQNFRTADRSRPFPDVFQTNDRGEFRAALEPGTYLFAYSSGRSNRGGFDRPNPATSGLVLYPGVTDTSTAIPVEVKAGEETRIRDVTLIPARRGAIRLRIINDTGHAPSRTVDMGIVQGDRVPGFNGLFINVEDGWDREITREYWPPLPGTYAITAGWRVAALDDAVVRASKVVEFTGADIEVELRVARHEGRMRGRVMMEPANGGALRPMDSARINLIAESGASIDDIFVSRDGTFSFSKLAPGRYDVRLLGVPADAYMVSARQGERDVMAEGVLVQVAQKEETPVEIVASSGAVPLSGKVTDAQGRAAHDATVVLVPDTKAGMSEMKISGRTDQNGAFELRFVVPGAYRIYAFPVTMLRQGSIDPEILKRFENRGTPLIVEKTSRMPVSLSLIE